MRPRSSLAPLTPLAPLALLAASAFAVSMTLSSASEAAPPTGPHPRIFLNPATVAALKTAMATPGSKTSAVIARCDAIVANPSRFSDGIYRGYGFAFNGSACALAWQLTQRTTYRDAALRYLNALLDDRDQIGDRAGGDNVVASQDSGYPLRYHGAFASIIYDWIAGAPGLDAQRTRARIKVWVDRYTADGYMRSTPGGNYHAGYVSAKTLAAIALSGEDPAGATYYNDVVNNLFTKQIGTTGLGPGGTLLDGDWPEGWEYAPFSMISYSLAWRALRETGIALPQVDQFFDDITPLYAHNLTPDKKLGWAGGDWGTDSIHATPSRGGVVASLIGGANAISAAWAAGMLKDPSLGGAEDCLTCEALAESRGVAAVDYVSTNPPTFYLARGTRNVYGRSSWQPSAFWTVFTSAPRLGPDHQHIDSSNFVLTRGSDHLIVDPSPYGSLSSQTSNAIIVDSNTVGADYRPCQSAQSKAELPWARGFESGVVGARAELSKAFQTDGNTDVPFARRDFTFLPEGEIVTIDRARTDAAGRGMQLRFRSLASLSRDGDVVKGTLGASSLAIHTVQLSGGAPELRKIARAECSGTRYGTCEGARYAVDEYRVKATGPVPLAIHVIDGLAAGEAPATVKNITSIDPRNNGVVGVELSRSGALSVVVSSSARDGVVSGELTYAATGDGEARHVVYDAPEDGAGKSRVTATAEGGKCVLKIGAGAGLDGRPLVFRVGPASGGCAVAEEKGSVSPKPSGGTPDGGPGTPGGPPGLGPDGGPLGPGAGGSNSGASCACQAVGVARGSALSALVASLGVLLLALRRRR